MQESSDSSNTLLDLLDELRLEIQNLPLEYQSLLKPQIDEVQGCRDSLSPEELDHRLQTIQRMLQVFANRTFRSQEGLMGSKHEAN